MNNVYYKVEWRAASGGRCLSDGGPYTTHAAAIRACMRVRDQVEADGGKCMGWVTLFGDAHVPTVDMLRGEADAPKGAA
jgi:hypothetical protein